MNGADARAGKHGDDGLGDHRHINNHPVALLDAEVNEHAAQRRHLVAEFQIGVGANGLGDGAVVDQRPLRRAPVLHVAIEAVVGRIAFGSGKPASVLPGIGIKHAIPRFVPVDRARGLGPEVGWIALPGGVYLVVSAWHGNSSCGAQGWPVRAGHRSYCQAMPRMQRAIWRGPSSDHWQSAAGDQDRPGRGRPRPSRPPSRASAPAVRGVHTRYHGGPQLRPS